MCGGTPDNWTKGVSARGLSPRVRGNRSGACRRVSLPWSIPACAGEPVCGRSRRRTCPVYPRVCGGTRVRSQPSPHLPGLSPRVRGNQDTTNDDAENHRSIPACAGEPLTSRNAMATVRVYPRVCGGTRPGNATPADRKGLSPRVRGNPPAVAADTRTKRSIPACAGEPGIWSSWMKRIGVYPRVCGGTGEGIAGLAQNGGLSPRVRGNQPGQNAGCGLGWSIPACAGEPRCLLQFPNPRSVYPRVCGGTPARW